MLSILWWTSISSGFGGGGGGGLGEEGILLVTPCWVSCHGVAFHPGRERERVIPSWVSCGGLAFHPGRGRLGERGGGSNTLNHFMLGIF